MNRVPLYTLRVRKHGNGCFHRHIKVRDDGPAQKRWMGYGRYLWLKHKGPIPDGFRVLHIDGDSLNDNLDNLILGTAADNAFLAHERVPGGHEAHYAKMRIGCAEHNRLRGRIKRATTWCAARWYMVDHDRREIINRPVRKRTAAYAAMGIDVPVLANGDKADSAALGWPDVEFTGACILHALIDAPGGRLSGDALIAAVERLRVERGERPFARKQTIYSVYCRLKKAGLIESIRTGGRRYSVYVVTAAAIAARRPEGAWTRAVPISGKSLLAGECRDYTRVDPELGSRRTVSPMDALAMLAAAMEDDAA